MNIIQFNDYKPTPADELDASLAFLAMSMDSFAEVMAKQPALFTENKKMLQEAAGRFLDVLNHVPTEQI